MSLAATYPWIKALHVASVIVFIAGTLAQALFLAAAKAGVAKHMTEHFHRSERALTIPAIVVGLVSGMTIAQVGSWFPSTWLIIKLILVVALLGVHGFQSGQLRRIAAGQAIAVRRSHSAVLAISSVIAVLAVAKP